MASIVSNVSTLVESGLREPALERRRTLALRIGAILGFLLGSLVELAAKGQLWIQVAATLERVAIGFGTGAALGVALGPAAGYLAPVRNVVEPLVEMLPPIPPLAMLPGPA
jgi:NitT/TauT family transport system permease protein